MNVNEEVSAMDSGDVLLAEAMDAAKKRYLDLCTCEDWSSLEEHDRKYHPDGYREGDSCKLRDGMKKGDESDGKVSAKTGGGDPSEYGWRPNGSSLSPMAMKMMQDKINREFGNGRPSFVQPRNDAEQTGRHPGQPHGLYESMLPKAEEISRFHANRASA